MMKTFPRAMGYAEATSTPVGTPCLACKVPIQEGDVGVVIPHMSADAVTDEPWHRKCFFTSLGINVADA